MRRTKSVSKSTVIQLDLFSLDTKERERMDLLIAVLINEAANTRYLITRIDHCYELPQTDRFNIRLNLDEVLQKYRTLCQRLQSRSSKYYSTNFNTLWRYKEYTGTMDVGSYPTVEQVYEHLQNCQKRIKSVKMSYFKLLGQSGTIIDEIISTYQINNYYFNYASKIRSYS